MTTWEIKLINRRNLSMNKSFIPEIQENLKSNKTLNMATSKKHIPIHDTKMFSHKQTNAVCCNWVWFHFCLIFVYSRKRPCCIHTLSGGFWVPQARSKLVKNIFFWFFLLGLKYTLRTYFESKNFLPKSCSELSNQVLSLQKVKFTSSFKFMCDDPFSNFWHLMVKFG